MARYADGLIAEGEHILLRTRQHWFSIVAYTVGLLDPGRDRRRVLRARPGHRLVVLQLGRPDCLRRCLDLGRLALRQLDVQDYIITNRRVMQVEGIVNKVSKDSSLEKINDAVLRQGLFGRLLHFGDLSILTASDTTVDDFKMLNDAANFKKAMLNAKYALEREVAAPMPSPPLRAPSTSAEGSTAPAATAGAAPAGAAEPTAPPPAAPEGVAMSPEEVTDTLHRLADLRDRGAISAAEYEAKKAELLERL